MDSIDVTNLNGKRIAVKKGGFPRALMETLHPRADMVFMENSLDGFRKLLRNEVDGVVEDEQVGYTILSQHDFHSISAMPESLASKIGHSAVAKGNPELLLQINEALKLLLENGKFDHIADKWAGLETVFIKKETIWLLLAVASIVLVLVAAAGGIAYLMRVRKARDELEQQVETRTNELQVAKQEAERATLTKSRFLASASHDLRQPLQSLNLLNEILRRTVGDAEAQKLLTKQKEAYVGMGSLLNSLLDISRLESGSVEPRFTDVPLQGVFETISAEFGEQARAKYLSLQIETTDAVAYTDPALAMQVIQNLVSNAIRYTTEGFVRLDCSREAGGLKITLTDSGIGIPKEQLSNIFTEFHQLERDPHEGNDGLGLGLAIVQRIAKMLDTRIDVASEIGKGSAFSFMLPVGTVKSAEPTRPAKIAIPSTSSTGTVLLIDDDINVLEATQILLEIEGYKVVVATSSPEAYAKLEELAYAPDIIVTDLHLAYGESGMDIVRSARARAVRPLPAIVVTGDTSFSIDELDVEISIKPVEPMQLLATIEKLLKKNEALMS